MSIQTLIDSTTRTAARAVDSARVNPKPIAHVVEAPAAKAPQPSKESERVKAAAQQLDNYLKSAARSLEFRVDEKSGVVVVKVHNSVTGEVIRQIPNEETLRLAERLADPLHGGSTVLDVLA